MEERMEEERKSHLSERGRSLRRRRDEPKRGSEKRALPLLGTFRVFLSHLLFSLSLLRVRHFLSLPPSSCLVPGALKHGTHSVWLPGFLLFLPLPQALTKRMREKKRQRGREKEVFCSLPSAFHSILHSLHFEYITVTTHETYHDSLSLQA